MYAKVNFFSTIDCIYRYESFAVINCNYMNMFLCFLSHKGTMVICNLGSVLKDSSQWEKPDQFYPEHFLDDQRNFRKREAFYPFSAGSLLLYFAHTYR